MTGKPTLCTSSRNGMAMIGVMNGAMQRQRHTVEMMADGGQALTSSSGMVFWTGGLSGMRQSSARQTTASGTRDVSSTSTTGPGLDHSSGASHKKGVCDPIIVTDIFASQSN